MCVGDVGNRLQVGDFQGRVGDSFAEVGAGFVVGGFGEALRVIRVDKADFDAESRKNGCELSVSAAVEILGRDDVVSGLGEVDDRVENGGGAGGMAESAHFVGALKECDAFLENVGGRVLEAGIDVAELFEREEVGGVLGAVELEG